MAHAINSVLESRPTKLLQQLQATVLAIGLGVICLVVLGTVVVCGAPPEEQDATNLPLKALPVDLNAGDREHNAYIAALAAEMEQNQYLLNGLIPISEDRPALLRGRQSAITMRDPRGSLEWRLQASLHPTFKAHSFVGLRSHDEPFSAELAQTLAQEWQMRGHVLPREVVETGHELLQQATQFHTQDSLSQQPYTEVHGDGMVRRGWQTCQSDPPCAAFRYCLTIEREIAGYKIILEMRDESSHSGRSMGSWTSIDFIRIPPTES